MIMKKRFYDFKTKCASTFSKVIGHVHAFIAKVSAGCNRAMLRTHALVSGNAAEGYVDSAMKIIISVVIGGLLLAGLYTLFNGTVIPTLTTKIGEMFSYSA